MIDHLSFGVADLARSGKFYEAALKPLGGKCLSRSDDGMGFGTGAAVFWVSPTSHPVPADPRSGLHVCFKAPTRKAVDAFHAAALKAGGTDNGKPGLRANYGADYYAAFVVDPDGYRIEAYTTAA